MSWQYWNSFTYLVCLGFLILRYRGEPTNGIRSKLSFICRATYLTVMSKNVLQCWSQVRRELERVCQCPGGLRALPHDAQPNPSRPIGVFKKTFRIRKSWWSAPRTPWAPFIPTWRVPTHNVRQPTCRAHSATPSPHIFTFTCLRGTSGRSPQSTMPGLWDGLAVKLRSASCKITMSVLQRSRKWANSNVSCLLEPWPTTAATPTSTTAAAVPTRRSWRCAPGARTLPMTCRTTARRLE